MKSCKRLADYLTLHLQTSSAMEHLAAEVGTVWAGEEDISSCYLDRHTRAVQRGFSNAQTLHHLWRIALGSRLKRCPAAKKSEMQSTGWDGCTYMIPGATALTRMPCFACCCAKERVNVVMAPLVDE